MEHRYHPRMQISLDVDIFRRNKLLGHNFLGHAQAKDISPRGMLLQNDRQSLKRNDVILLQTMMNGEVQVMHCLVIHTSRQHAGVMLFDVSEDASRAIVDLLKENEFPLEMALDRLDKQAKVWEV